MLDVFITIDTEVWCGAWDDLDARFPEAFRSYVYGPTANGNAALPLTVDILNDHGLTGVFFVEPLFSARFGRAPLQEMVGLIAEARQEIQLHLHTEWIDEAASPDLPTVSEKRQYMKHFSAGEQARIMETGRRYLQEAGAAAINAHRAGGFGGNADTLKAAAAAGIDFDLSYDALYPWPADNDVSGATWRQPFASHGTVEYPMTVYEDRPGHLRHLQVTACSYAEMAHVLRQAADAGYHSVVILSHNTELMNQSKTRIDPVAVRRFRKLCRLLADNRDVFNVRGFSGLTPPADEDQGPLLKSGIGRSCGRVVEQAWRRRYG